MSERERLVTSTFSAAFTGGLNQRVHKTYGVNAYTVKYATICWTSLLVDSPLNLTGMPRRVVKKFFFDLLEDFSGYANFLSDLCDKLIRSTDGQAENDVLLKDSLFNLFKKTPVLREFISFNRTKDPQVFRFLLTFLRFGKKVGFKDDTLLTTALRTWYDVEDRLASTPLPSWVAVLRKIVTDLLKGFRLTYLPKHGSGRVAEAGVYGSNQKNRQLTLDARLMHTFFGGISPVNPSMILPDPAAVTTDNFISDEFDVSSRLKFVWKNNKTMRSICMEPIRYQWAQQCVLLDLTRAIDLSPLRRHVFLRDQSVNRQAALFGSLTGVVDTIDLSSASDSVGVDLVRAIFPPNILRFLLGTRTSLVQVPDQDLPIRVKKFAPMGSALCFPVQCIVFSAVVVLAATLYADNLILERDTSRLMTYDYRRLFTSLFNKELCEGSDQLAPFRVYGDDIICDNRITAVVIDLLTQLRFQVNTEKSFVGDIPFRESCGIFCLDGADVTPLTFKVKPLERKVSVDTLQAMISLCNRAYEYKYRTLRANLIRYILHVPLHGYGGVVNPVLFSEDPDETMSILSEHPVNSHLKKREFTMEKSETFDWSKTTHDRPGPSYLRYQVDEVKSITRVPNEDQQLSEQFDNYWYLIWQRSRVMSEETMASDVEAIGHEHEAFDSRLGWRWTPA